MASLYSYAPNSGLQAKIQARTLALLRSSLLSNLPVRPPAAAAPGRHHSAQAQGPAKVRVGRDPLTGQRVLCPGETAAILARRRTARIHLQRFLTRRFLLRPTLLDPPFAPAAAAATADGTLDAADGADDDSLPRIGLCTSGGGSRAMLSSLGSLSSLQQQGLFDASEYIAGLSGSTWAMSQIYANSHHIQIRSQEISKLKLEWEAKQAASSAASACSGNDDACTSTFNPLLHSPVDLPRVRRT